VTLIVFSQINVHVFELVIKRQHFETFILLWKCNETNTFQYSSRNQLYSPRVKWNSHQRIHLLNLSCSFEICIWNAIKPGWPHWQWETKLFSQLISFHFKRVDFSCYVITRLSTPHMFTLQNTTPIALCPKRPQPLQPNMLQAVNYLNSRERLVHNGYHVSTGQTTLVTLAATIGIVPKSKTNVLPTRRKLKKWNDKSCQNCFISHCPPFDSCK
jgi:hypothetical protein